MMNKVKFKNIFALIRRDFDSNKKLFLVNIIFLLIVVFIVFFNIDFDNISEKYLFSCVLSLSFGFASSITVGSALLISEEKNVFKTLKCLPVTNREIYISKLLFIFFNEICFLIIPMVIFILFSDLNYQVAKHLEIKIFYLYLLAFFLTTLFISTLIFVLSLIKRNIGHHFLIILVTASSIFNTVPYFKNSKIMKSNPVDLIVKFEDDFLYTSLFLSFLLLPLIYLGYRLFEKNIYSLCEK